MRERSRFFLSVLLVLDHESALRPELQLEFRHAAALDQPYYLG